MQETIRTSNALSLASRILVNKKITSVLVVTGRHPGQPTIQEAFQQSLHLVSPLGNLNTDKNIQQVFNECPVGVQSIVAIGGGFTIDAAKLLMMKYIGTGCRPFFIAIPTTAGSGSEATPLSVSYAVNKKLSIIDSRLLPDIALLDGKLLNELPPQQRAISGIDTVAQAIESTWSNNANATSIQFSAFVLKDFFPKLIEFAKGANQHNHKLLWRSNLAGKAIAITRTTGPHAMSYYLTSHFGVSHGQSVALYLPLFFIYNANPASSQARERMQKIYSWLGVKDQREACNYMTDLIKQVGLASRFRDLDLIVDIEALLDEVNEERFSNNPVPFERNRLRELIQEYLM